MNLDSVLLLLVILLFTLRSSIKIKSKIKSKKSSVQSRRQVPVLRRDSSLIHDVLESAVQERADIRDGDLHES